MKEFKVEIGDLRPVLGIGGNDDETIVRLRNVAMMEDTADAPVMAEAVYGVGPMTVALRADKATRVQPGDWIASLTKDERKECAVERGFFAYFPDAIALVARHSVRSNEKHNPGQPVHWAREKSKDQGDCIARHSLAIAVDPNAKEDGQYEIVSRAWRAMADLQLWAEEKVRRGEKV